MSSFVVYIIIMALWNVILFCGSSYGISVILFMLPLMILLYYYFKKNNLIKNKSGLLFMIPILLISFSYLVFNNTLLYSLNFPVIIVLMLLMYIYTIKPTYKLSELFGNMGSLLFEPIGYIGKFGTEVKNVFNKKSGLSEQSRKNIKSILIIIPIVLVVLALLMHADLIFNDLFKGIVDFFKNIKIFDNLISKIITFVFIFFAIGSSLLFISERFMSTPREESKLFKSDANTIKLLIIVLDIIYVVFDYIQINSLILHSVSSSIDYATYARQGFFELLAVSIINITIILLSKKFKVKDKKENNIINISSIIMIILTSIIIVSSFLRMNLYEAAYGYTMLRLLVYISLITESILLIPTIIYILNPKFNIVKYYLTIVICVYTMINYCNLDYIIAKRNIDRYYNSTMKIVDKNFNYYNPHDSYSYRLYKYTNLDLNYLMNNKTDNISLLVDLYNRTTDPYMINALNMYFKEIEEENDYTWEEFNISKYNALKELEELQKRNPQI